MPAYDTTRDRFTPINDFEPLIDKAEVARRLVIPKRTLDYWVFVNSIPVVRLGHRTVRFRWSDVEKYFAEKTAAAVAKSKKARG